MRYVKFQHLRFGRPHLTNFNQNLRLKASGKFEEIYVGAAFSKKQTNNLRAFPQNPLE